MKLNQRWQTQMYKFFFFSRILSGLMEKLLQGKQVPQFLLLLDTISQPSTPFLQSFCNPIVFSTENRSNAISIPFRPNLQQLLMQLNRNNNGSDGDGDGVGGGGGVAVLESIGGLVLAHSFDLIVSFLHDLFHSSQWTMLVLIVHQDLPCPFHSELVGLLESYCDGRLSLRMEEGRREEKRRMVVDYCVTLAGGRVKRETMGYSVVDGRVSLFQPQVFQPLVSSAPPQSKKKESILESVSFKLDLTEKEKSQREGVVLPFMEAQNRNAVIEYTYDEDEFDDEDPDDDLDF
jgi:hypothetical protein